MQNSGVFPATSWRKMLLRLRTKLMTQPGDTGHRHLAIRERTIGKGGSPPTRSWCDTLALIPNDSRPTVRRERVGKESSTSVADELILSTVSYLRPFKKPQMLVQTCRELASRKVPVRLFVAGDGEMLPDLKELSQATGSCGSDSLAGKCARSQEPAAGLRHLSCWLQ